MKKLKRKLFFKIPASFFIVTTVFIGIIFFKFFDLTPQIDPYFFFASDDPQLKEDNMISDLFPDNTSQIILGIIGQIETQSYYQSISWPKWHRRTAPGSSGRNTVDVKSERCLYQSVITGEYHRFPLLVLFCSEGEKNIRPRQGTRQQY